MKQKSGEFPIKCTFLDCLNFVDILNGDPKKPICSFHNKGGMLGNGELFQQYEVIEQDFLDFIKVVPLSSEHFEVHSPFLGDIIIRACVQLEIFFKEWGKQICFSSDAKSRKLLEKYQKNDRGVKNWTIGDYYIFKDEFKHQNPVHIMPLNIQIMPFDSWKTEKNPPDFWNAYNEIKHGGGSTIKKYQTLKMALLALTALYLVHYTNTFSKKYLSSFVNTIIYESGFSRKPKTFSSEFSTPIDSKKYLLKIVNSGSIHETSHPIAIN